MHLSYMKFGIENTLMMYVKTSVTVKQTAKLETKYHPIIFVLRAKNLPRQNNFYIFETIHR